MIGPSVQHFDCVCGVAGPISFAILPRSGCAALPSARQKLPVLLETYPLNGTRYANLKLSKSTCVTLPDVSRTDAVAVGCSEKLIVASPLPAIVFVSAV